MGSSVSALTHGTRGSAVDFGVTHTPIHAQPSQSQTPPHAAATAQTTPIFILLLLLCSAVTIHFFCTFTLLEQCTLGAQT